MGDWVELFVSVWILWVGRYRGDLLDGSGRFVLGFLAEMRVGGGGE